MNPASEQNQSLQVCVPLQVEVISQAENMANKTVDMSKLKQVLRLYKNGDMSNRGIAEALDLDKNTVNKYVNQAKKDSMSIDELLALDDPVLAHRMAGGNAAYTDSRFDELKDKLPYYAAELQRPHVTIQLLWEEYSKEAEHPYQITQFKEHLNRYIAGSGQKTASTILKDLYVGGEKAFLDFTGGRMGYVDIDTGEVHEVEIFVATLPATDYGFATAVPSQKVEDFLMAVERFFGHIGGVEISRHQARERHARAQQALRRLLQPLRLCGHPCTPRASQGQVRGGGPREDILPQGHRPPAQRDVLFHRGTERSHLSEDA